MLAETVYILLFRGVGGATQLPTAPLRAALTKAGFGNVATYINSGNAVLSTSLSRDEMLARVAEICRKQFKFEKDIHVRTKREWETLVKNNPFGEPAEGKHLHAAVLADRVAPGAIEALRRFQVEGERLEVVGKVAYLFTPHGFGTSEFAKRFDKGIGVPNTARNWNTVLALQKLARAIEL